MSSTDNIGQFPLCSPANTVTPVTVTLKQSYITGHIMEQAVQKFNDSTENHSFYTNTKSNSQITR